jgi:AcrR family transcriptional regulator
MPAALAWGGLVVTRSALGAALRVNGELGQLAEIQRSRLLTGAVGAVDELGYEQATVASITARARVSRRTFYELFLNREECVAAVLEDTAGRVRSELRAAGLEELPWQERVRRGLWVILCFLEREPTLARVCMVQAQRGSGAVLERRERILAELVAVVDAGRMDSARGLQCSGLTAEGAVGAALAILYPRLTSQRRERPTGLLGELMGLIVLPYRGPAAARREQTRAAPAAPRIRHSTRQTPASPQADPLAGLSMRLTYRTAKVLEGIDENPGASNRQVAEYAGINDQGQISKLLARLERLGLLVNEDSGGHAKGASNAWSLTPTGARVTRSIGAHANNAHRQAA